MDYKFAQLLISIILLIAGLMLKITPPQKINTVFGYRTSLSMSNHESWKLGNRISANILIFGSLFLIMINVVSFFVKSNEILLTAVYLASVIVVLALTFLITQKRLKTRLQKRN